MTEENMYLLILFFPLISFIVAATFGRYLGQKGSTFITTSCIFITAILSTIGFIEVTIGETNCYLQMGTWIDCALLHASWGLLFDPLSCLMTIVVSYVSALVHMYSIEYMGHDPHIQRFMSYLSLFTFFMLVLVTADNFIQMFIGWEGVGLASFLLINFWTTRLQANKAAMKALIVNRIGDFGLCLGIFGIFFVYGAVDYSTVFATVPSSYRMGATQAVTVGNNDGPIDVISFCGVHFSATAAICLFLFIGAVGKSAQIGLHTWLPDAMEGPTPVSALIHAATMVTAGVFLIVRCSPIFEYAPSISALVAFIGAVTAFFAATTGAFQNDLKRVIAYSTCSQLGYMIFACGLSSYSVTMFHLTNHAFFKALLFLSAGSIIHAMHDEQDMRKMGALNRVLPFTYTMILIGSFALIGFPLLTGYYSKDFILELACSKIHFTGNIAYWLGTLSVSFTTFYSYRLVFLTFLNSSRRSAGHARLYDAAEPNIFMALPLVLLSTASIFIGYLGKDMIIGLGSAFWGNSLYALPSNEISIEAEYLPYHIKLIPLVFSHIGIFLAYNISSGSRDARNGTSYPLHEHGILYRRISTFFSQSWGISDLHNRFIVRKTLGFGYHTSFRLLDAGWISYLGPTGIAKSIDTLSNTLSKLQTGYVYHYAYITLTGTVLFYMIYLWADLQNGPCDGTAMLTTLVDQQVAEVSLWSISSLYFVFVLTFFHLLTGEALARSSTSK